MRSTTDAHEMNPFFKKKSFCLTFDVQNVSSALEPLSADGFPVKVARGVQSYIYTPV